jgi:hypothetical protein
MVVAITNIAVIRLNSSRVVVKEADTVAALFFADVEVRPPAPEAALTEVAALTKETDPLSSMGINPHSKKALTDQNRLLHNKVSISRSPPKPLSRSSMTSLEELKMKPLWPCAKIQAGLVNASQSKRCLISLNKRQSLISLCSRKMAFLKMRMLFNLEAMVKESYQRHYWLSLATKKLRSSLLTSSTRNLRETFPKSLTKRDNVAPPTMKTIKMSRTQIGSTMPSKKN